MPDCSELLRRYAKDRTEAAFAEVVRQQIDFVYAVALRRVNGDAHLAKDVSQAVFTDLARKAHFVAERPSVAGWLCRSTQFAAGAAIRAESRRRIREVKAQLMHDLQSKSRHDAPWGEIRPLLDQALNKLSDSDRDALTLRYFEEKPFSEIGKQLRIADNTARMRVDRALEKLRLVMARHGVTSTAAALAEVLSSEPGVAAPAGMAATITHNALASLSAAGSPALGFLQFMSTAKTIVGTAGLLGITTILCLPIAGIGISEFVNDRRIAASLVTATASYQAAQTKFRLLESSAKAAELKEDELQKMIDTLRLSASESRSASTRFPAEAASQDRKSDGQRFLTAFPETRAMLIELGKSQFSSIHAPFYRSAGLAADQIEKLENAATDTWLQTFPLTPKSVGMLPSASDIPAPQLRQMLGDQAFQQLQGFERTAIASGWAGQMAASVGYSAEPLSMNQTDQLVQIMAVNSESYQDGQNVAASSIDWDAVLSQAKSAVSVSQWPAVQSALLRMKYQQALEQAQVSNGASTNASSSH